VKVTETLSTNFANPKLWILANRPCAVNEVIEVFKKGPVGDYILQLEASVRRAEKALEEKQYEALRGEK
jgi:hypothetical protein